MALSSPLSLSCRCVALLLALSLCLSLPVISAQPLAPVITGVTGCPASSDGSTLLCALPTTLTLSGLNFSPTDLVNVSSTLCTPTGTSTSLTCALPNSSPLFATSFNSPLPVSVIDVATGLSSPTVSISLQSIPPVVLTSISGCMGSGAVTTSCDLSSALITLTGSGFQPDNQPWYLIYSTPTGWFTDQPGYVRPVAYPITGGPAVVLPLNYTLSATLPSAMMSGSSASQRNGSMALCFSHGNTLSNCLSLTWYYNTSTPTSSPAFPGLVTDSNMTITGVSTTCAPELNSTAVGCAPPFYVNIAGTNLPTSSLALVSVGSTRCINPVNVGSGLRCYIPDEYTASSPNTPLPLLLLHAARLTQTVYPAAVQLSQPPPIVVSSISGCPGDMLDALSTSGCDVQSDYLRIVGSGFDTSLLSSPWQVVWSLSGYLFYSQVTNYITSNSTILLPLSTVSGLLASATSSSVNATLCLLHDAQLTSTPCFSVGLAVPPATVSSLSGCSGFSTAGGLNASVTDCQAGVSLLTINGANFRSAVSVTVGGQACVSSAQTQVRLVCTVPIVQSFQPGVGYDVVVSGGFSSVTLPSALTFSAHPTIYQVTSQYCPFIDYPGRTGVPALYCADNATLTIVGSYFSELSTLAVQLSSAYSPTPLQCGDLQFASSSVLTCTLPQLESRFPQRNFYASQLTVDVAENATYFSNPLTSILYYSPSDPHLNSVQGCDASVTDTRGVAGCHTGDVVTLVGSSFPAASQLSVQLLSNGELFTCTSAKWLSSSALTCTLPYVPPSTAGTVLPIRIVPTTSGSRPSNWLIAIDFDPSPASASNGDLKLLISLSTLLPVLVLLMLLVSVMCWQRQKAGGGAGAGEGGHVGEAAQR